MGPWGIALVALLGVALTEGGRKAVRKVTKEVIRAGYEISDKSSTVVGELKEKTTDLIAEVRAEQSNDAAETTKSTKKRKKATVEES